MFVREMEEYAVAMARKAGFAFCKMAESNPSESFKFFASVCSEASAIDRKFPGFYQAFSEAVDVEKAKYAFN